MDGFLGGNEEAVNTERALIKLQRESKKDKNELGNLRVRCKELKEQFDFFKDSSATAKEIIDLRTELEEIDGKYSNQMKIVKRDAEHGKQKAEQELREIRAEHIRDIGKVIEEQDLREAVKDKEVAEYHDKSDFKSFNAIIY